MGNSTARAFARSLGLVWICVLIGSCSAQAARPATGKPAAATPDALYADIDKAVKTYREGLHKMRLEDEREAGRALMDQAAAQLAAGGDACVRTPGCEPQRFMAAYANLLSQRSAALAGAPAAAGCVVAAGVGLNIEGRPW